MSVKERAKLYRLKSFLEGQSDRHLQHFVKYINQ